MRRLLAYLLAASALLFWADSARAAVRPNFVVFQTDDQNAAMFWERFGSQRAMPFLHRILPQGRLLTGYQVASPICAPSRASFFSGQHPHNHQVIYNDTGGGGVRGGFDAWRQSPAYYDNFVVRLQAAGYHTAHLGKFFNNYVPAGAEDIPPGWNTWVTDSDDRSTRQYYGYNQIVRMPEEEASLRGPFGSPFYSFQRGLDALGCARCNYHTDRISRIALAEIEQTDGPFYLQLGFHTPHGDHVPPAGAQPATRHLGLARRARVPRQSSYNERRILDKPAAVRRAPLSRSEKKKIGDFWRTGLASLRSVDDSIRSVYKLLEARGLLENTYLVFLSDNGIFMGSHRFGLGKSLPYRDAVKIPAWIHGPRFYPRRSARPVSGVDWAPTFLDLAGVDSSGLRFDGQSLLEPSSYWRAQLVANLNWADLLGEPFPETDKASGKRYRSLEIGPYRYTRYWGGGAELYDFRFDGDEEYNQVGVPGYKDLALWMERRLQRARSCEEKSCNFAARPPTPSGWTRSVDSGRYPALPPKE